ncbi:hypothetical protein [Anaeromyxobacter diazotrophicus]|uniref:Lipoprotein n=1 Tax=Anaeromyxobacter diazotrophicus TaxID=2590199 RepID=A0A7I9VM45_9BACT|nr:hypothetical protein [Anaeromyxobacter diazotrophicus]GEJ57471.1 hypothetical protein AMYX_22120 [Anaeromyxobacter diazotrophicus]
MTGAARRAGLALAVSAVAAALLAGCPLPQPLAEVARVDGGVISPPRIVAESAVPAETIIFVSQGCSAAVFSLGAEVEDVNTLEAVEARWFVDYQATLPQIPLSQPVPAGDDPANPIRAVVPYPFDAVAWNNGVPLHVVELVVSNAFKAITPTDARQNHSAQDGFETAVYRWVFQYVPAGDARGRCQ